MSGETLTWIIEEVCEIFGKTTEESTRKLIFQSWFELVIKTVNLEDEVEIIVERCLHKSSYRVKQSRWNLLLLSRLIQLLQPEVKVLNLILNNITEFL